MHQLTSVALTVLLAACTKTDDLLVVPVGPAMKSKV